MLYHRFTVQRLVFLLVVLCHIDGYYTEEAPKDGNAPLFADVSPLTDMLKDHVDKFKQLRDDLKALQNRKDNQNPLVFFRETMRIMEGLQSLGKEWKDIERIQNEGNREFEVILEEMDPMCGQVKPRAALFEIELRCMYTDLGGNPYYIIGPLKQEQVNRIPYAVTMYHDLLTKAEVKQANETRTIEPSVRRRLDTLVPNLFNVAVREATKSGYNGSNVKHRGLSMMLYLESHTNSGITIFPEGLFTVAPTSGSLLVSKVHPSICPSSNSVQVITNFFVSSKKQMM
uniref:Prolyl 4-hydroxylase alpha-subunit N-terminal domain-containing protein n=1 Tax=Anopheles minimus TaxID=112268 RepID=A0A182WFI7_9DIPT